MVYPASTERTVLAGSTLLEASLTINSALNMMWCIWTALAVPVHVMFCMPSLPYAICEVNGFESTVTRLLISVVADMRLGAWR